MQKKIGLNIRENIKTVMRLAGALICGALISNYNITAAYADTWKSTLEGTMYMTDDFSVSDGNIWLWLDDDKNGIHECYYFNEDNCLVTNTTVDGYQVNEKGQWVVDGVVQTKQGSVTEEMNIEKFNAYFSASNLDGISVLERTEVLINNKIREILPEYITISHVVQVGSWYYLTADVTSSEFGGLYTYDTEDPTVYFVRIRCDGGAAEIISQYSYDARPGQVEFSSKGKLIFSNGSNYSAYDLRTGQFSAISADEYEALKSENIYGSGAVFDSIGGKYYRYDNDAKKMFIMNVDGSVAEEKYLDLDVPEMHRAGFRGGIPKLEAVNDDKIYFSFGLTQNGSVNLDYRIILDKNTLEQLSVVQTDAYSMLTL